MKAYLVTLTLYERDDPDSDWHRSKGDGLKFITVAKDLSRAASYVTTAWMKKDRTDQAEFEWRATGCQELEGEVLL